MSSLLLASARYTRTAMLLHWLVALLIIINVTLALSVDSLPEGWERPIIDTHKSIGITVLGLVLLRLLWRAAHAPPPLPSNYPRWEKFSAHLAHGLLYVLIVALPLSGWLHDSAWKDAATHPMRLFNLFPWPRIGFVMGAAPSTKETLHTLFGNWHRWLGYALYVLFALHVLGALKHQFLDKEPELQRMLPWGKPPAPPDSARH
jgi:cytochrome b561